MLRLLPRSSSDASTRQSQGTGASLHRMPPSNSVLRLPVQTWTGHRAPQGRARHGTLQQPCPGPLDRPRGQTGGLKPALEVGRGGLQESLAHCLRKRLCPVCTWRAGPLAAALQPGNGRRRRVHQRNARSSAAGRRAGQRCDAPLALPPAPDCLGKALLRWVQPAGALHQ